MLIIKKNISYNKECFQTVIDEVNISDIVQYIISAIDDNWAPNCYWKIKSKEEEIFFAELLWVVYSYLIHNEIIIIEDPYFEYNKHRTEKYKNRLSYHNPLENNLYIPIIKRMSDEGYLTSEKTNYYKLGKMYWRNVKLDKLLN